MRAQALVNGAIDAYMLWSSAFLRGPLLRAARDPARTQQALLMSILSENADTAFGREHDFASISSMADYRARVPVQDYDQLESYILDQQNGTAALTAEPPIYYVRSSGTTGRSKDIPLTRRGLNQVKHAQTHLSLALWRDTDFFKGSILGFASPATEGRLKNGKPYGSTSGSSYRSLSPLVAGKFILPQTAFSIEDLEAKYQVYALAALASDNVTGVVAANPSSILKVADIIDAEAPQLLEALASGSADAFHPEAAEVAGAVISRREPSRVRRLREQLETHGILRPEDIWPRLSAIATWTGGSCGIALERLRIRLPEAVRVVEYGYGSSEFMGAVNVDATSNVCLPLLTHHVYEFVRRADWDAGRQVFLGLHEIEPGEAYYVFVTTHSGLYRYNINDIVIAEAGVGICPGLRFLQKGRGVTNITGEKLSEHQLIAAVADVTGAEKLSAASYMALADEEASGYVVFLECPGTQVPEGLADLLDSRLRALNSEYDDKRASGRLKSLRLKRFADGAGDQIKSWSVERGLREAQYKPVLLDYARNWTEKLIPLTVDDHEA